MSSEIQSKKNFFIKDNYLPDFKASSIEAAPGEYWTAERLRMSRLYQYDVYLLAKKIAQKNNFKKVLDLGCGPATKAQMFFDESTYSVSLIDQESCSHITRQQFPNAKFYSMDLELCDSKIQLQKQDIVICADVVEHLLDPSQCIQFAHSILQPQGLAIFSTPERDILRGFECTTSGHSCHVREWNSNEFRRLLHYFGFNVITQCNYPVKKKNLLDKVISLFSKKHAKIADFHGCQVAICKK
jgi:predicted TPR repeat methyltransferase